MSATATATYPSRRYFHSLPLLLCLISVATSSDQLHSLLKIKSSLRSPVFQSWISNNSVCDFSGIVCDPNGVVKEIQLSNQRLTGSVPFDSICQIKSLKKLSLGFNSLTGPISDELRNCVVLEYLDLGNNFFAGEVPDISPLAGLKHLYLNNSGFSGAFPWDSLSNMKGLVALSLGDNGFDRAPLPEFLIEFTQLTWLYLSNCSVEGVIPSGIGNLTELINLELADNFISGEIPPGITNLKKLWQLELYHNSLTGKLPAGFGNLTNLEKFDASRNSLEGDLSELRPLTKLVSLQLFENRFTGEVPEEFGEFKRLVNLSLYGNMLNGSLPLRLGSWAEFDFIDVSENFLTGPIPPDMCKKGKMTEILMLQNKFTGEFPASYGSCTSLTRIRISNNSLSGMVPSGVWGLPKVGLIDIAMNKFEGPITSDIGNAKSLTQLLVSDNLLSGELPPEISNPAGLISIDLRNNRFTGQVPATIGELKQLYSIHFENNMFSGAIPDTIGSSAALNDINMANNSFTGRIPASIGSLPALNSLNLSGNELSGQIPETLVSLRLSLLDLSYNRLTGPIPQFLTVEAYNGSLAGNNGLCSQNINSFRPCSSNSGRFRNLRITVLCVAVGAIFILLSVLCIFYFNKNFQKDAEARSLKEDSWDVKSFHVLTFTEDEILDSIKEDNLIGKGGSGNVYKVMVANGKELAVKHIWNSPSGGGRKSRRSSASPLAKSPEFDAEVKTLSSIRHMNVVKLYCSITSDDSSLLVYEYMPNGSLWDRLHSCEKMALDWDTRYNIAVGAAKGLEYLHHCCDKPVIHRDVKSSNILLDELLKPRIADFGLAKIVQVNATKDSSHIVAGTHGYIAPEYGYTCKVNEKSDVYSFGIVLMELVTGKRPIEPEFGESKDIVFWVSSNLKSKESVLSIVDSSIPEVFKEEAIKVLRVAILCTARLPTLRPMMRSVVQMLEEAEPCKLIGIIINKDNGNAKK